MSPGWSAMEVAPKTNTTALSGGRRPGRLHFSDGTPALTLDNRVLSSGDAQAAAPTSGTQE